MKKIIYILIFIVLITIYVNIDGNYDYINNKAIKETSVIGGEDIKKYYNIKIGDSESSVINKIGLPDRKDLSEYGFTWYVYNRFEKNFIMVGIDNNKVVGLYSNSLDSEETEGIRLNDKQELVRQNYKAIEYKKKGNTKFMIESDNQFDIILKNNKYITIFYDLHKGNKVISYQVIDKNIEDSTKDIYPTYSDELKESFELQIIDLTNSVREKNNLNRLNFSSKAKISSIKHSEDMRNKNYFDHVNKNNESPFDRMKKEKIKYSLAGENIAAGQVSAIYAHEAWMNSLGHRKNILGDYENIGVGVSFGGHYKIYYTQNFYSE
ncbi:CAP domain-containing protein [Paraclostridium bifermentans]|uniref:CAP domain-containing protein n=1 Tax=Paraclostridium bifermentans TaxID=1490 RepID=UPI00359C5C74